MRCAECGALASEFTRVCAECGAPPVGWRSAASPPPDGPAGPGGPGRPGRNRIAALAVAVTAVMKQVLGAVRAFRWPPAGARRAQRYLVISLMFFLVLYLAGIAVLIHTSQRSGLHRAMDPVILVGLSGALLSFLLVEAFRFRFRVRQVMWALVPIVSGGWLAFVPFLWLALVRRRLRDWAAVATYLAATLALLPLVEPTRSGVNDTQVNVPYYENLYVVFAGLLLIAPIHTVMAFSPMSGPTTFREARARPASGPRPSRPLDSAGFAPPR
jgi:hypothetical protein